MHDTVWQPGQHIKDGVLVSRQDIAEVGTVEDVFKCWENSNPDRRTIGTRDKPAIYMVSSNVHMLIDRYCGIRRRRRISLGADGRLEGAR